eukprot:5650067-Prymnesium_polylepis.1
MGHRAFLRAGSIGRSGFRSAGVWGMNGTPQRAVWGYAFAAARRPPSGTHIFWRGRACVRVRRADAGAAPPPPPYPS